MRLAGRVAVITGAAGGIGGAIARRFAQEGAALYLLDRADTGPLATELSRDGQRTLGARADLTQHDAVHQAIGAALEAFGHIDILVNAHGINSHGPAETLAEAEWDRVMAHNLKSVFLSCQAVIAPMRARRYGRIVNIGSILGKNGGNPRPWIDRAEQARAGNVAYGAAKAGVHAITLFLAKELGGDGITVNAVAPGPIASAMTVDFPDTLRALIPVGRMGQGADVADAVAFLAGEQAGFANGEILDLNGGMWVD
ncbi:MAG: SDR family NAD(P)-dependent oxidoreductase [Acetobacteraceae bacterium]